MQVHWVRFLEGRAERFGTLEGTRVRVWSGNMFEYPERGDRTLAMTDELTGSDPQGLVGADRQMRGSGAMIAFELAGGHPAAEAIIAGLELFTHAVSLGGVDSLVQHPASLTHRPVASDARPGAGILRLSIGLEHVEDLWADLDRGLTAERRAS